MLQPQNQKFKKQHKYKRSNIYIKRSFRRRKFKYITKFPRFKNDMYALSGF